MFVMLWWSDKGSHISMLLPDPQSLQCCKVPARGRSALTACMGITSAQYSAAVSVRVIEPRGKKNPENDCWVFMSCTSCPRSCSSVHCTLFTTLRCVCVCERDMYVYVVMNSSLSYVSGGKWNIMTWISVYRNCCFIYSILLYYFPVGYIMLWTVKTLWWGMTCFTARPDFQHLDVRCHLLVLGCVDDLLISRFLITEPKYTCG